MSAALAVLLLAVATGCLALLFQQLGDDGERGWHEVTLAAFAVAALLGVAAVAALLGVAAVAADGTFWR